MTLAPIRLSGAERLVSSLPDLAEADVLDFWQWAFSDLRANNLRGVFAEWLVAKLLGIQPPVRDSWAAWDLITPEGVKLEVKAAAYLQSWTQPNGYSRISFGGLKGQTWSPEAGDSGVQTYNADLYIFCVQIEKHPDLWNALQLDQWRFYAVRRDQLERYNARTLSLSTVNTFATEAGAASLTAQQFRERLPEMVADTQSGRTG